MATGDSQVAQAIATLAGALSSSSSQLQSQSIRPPQADTNTSTQETRCVISFVYKKLGTIYLACMH